MTEEMVMFVTTDGEIVQIHASAVKSVSRNGTNEAKVICHDDEYLVSDLAAERLIEELFSK